MNICAVQFQPVAGNIAANLDKHLACLHLAATQGAGFIIFPELSLSGYEPLLAASLATTIDDPVLEPLHASCDASGITAGVGLPIATNDGIQIGMVLLQPGQERKLYCKQLLHEDELPYFIPGNFEVVLEVQQNLVAPAICYESLQPVHAAKAASMGAQVYAASVAKSQAGVEKAYRHYPAIAQQYGMAVLMSNCTGPCDNFIAAGQSAAWNADGSLAGNLNAKEEGVLLLDTDTGLVKVLKL